MNERQRYAGELSRISPIAPGARYPADALVEFEEAGEAHHFVTKVSTVVDREVAIGHVMAQLDQLLRGFPDHGLLLVTRFITPRMADRAGSWIWLSWTLP